MIKDSTDFRQTRPNLQINYDDPLEDLRRQSKYITIVEFTVVNKLEILQSYISSLRAMLHKTKLFKIASPVSECDYLCNYLVESAEQEIQNMQINMHNTKAKMLPIIHEQIIKRRQQIANIESNISKKHSQLNVERQVIQEIEKKYNKKYKQMMKKQQTYVTNLIKNKGFLQKNNLCLNTMQYYESQVLPTKIQYESRIGSLRNSMQSFCALNQKTHKYVKNDIEPCLATNIKRIVHDSALFIEQRYKNVLKTHQQKFQEVLQNLASIKKTSSSNNKISRMIVPSTYDYYYFFKLFQYASKPKQMQLEQLIDFGIMPPNFQECRSSISDSVISETETNYENNLNLKFVYGYSQQKISQIKKYFLSVFMSPQKKDKQSQQLLKLTRNQQRLRKVVLLCFQVFRQNEREEIPPNNLPNILYYLNYFLDQCLEQSDIYNSKFLLSQLFNYYVVRQEQQIHLYLFFREHPIWYNCSQWWQCSFIQSCYEALNAKPNSNLALENTITLWLIKGIGESNELIHMDPTSKIFGLLDSFTVRMQSMLIHKQIINKLVSKYVQCFELKKIVDRKQYNFEKYLTININGEPKSQSSQSFLKWLFH